MSFIPVPYHDKYNGKPHYHEKKRDRSPPRHQSLRSNVEKNKMQQHFSKKRSHQENGQTKQEWSKKAPDMKSPIEKPSFEKNRMNIPISNVDERAFYTSIQFEKERGAAPSQERTPLHEPLSDYLVSKLQWAQQDKAVILFSWDALKQKEKDVFQCVNVFDADQIAIVPDCVAGCYSSSYCVSKSLSCKQIVTGDVTIHVHSSLQ